MCWWRLSYIHASYVSVIPTQAPIYPWLSTISSCRLRYIASYCTKVQSMSCLHKHSWSCDRSIFISCHWGWQLSLWTFASLKRHENTPTLQRFGKVICHSKANNLANYLRVNGNGFEIVFLHLVIATDSQWLQGGGVQFNPYQTRTVDICDPNSRWSQSNLARTWSMWQHALCHCVYRT